MTSFNPDHPPDFGYAGPFAEARRRMVERDLWGRGIRDERVLAAMLRVPREDFIDPELHAKAYEDHPLDIGFGQTISQPYIVTKIAELASCREGDRLLEIGAGCGYQAAVLLELGAQLFALEIVPELAEMTRERLTRMGYANFDIRAGDGYEGLAAAAPFKAIILSAAPKEIPPPLPGQLAEGGRLVGPVGIGEDQKLVRVTRRGDKFITDELFPVRYVPMTGRARGE